MTSAYAEKQTTVVIMVAFTDLAIKLAFLTKRDELLKSENTERLIQALLADKVEISEKLCKYMWVNNARQDAQAVSENTAPQILRNDALLSGHEPKPIQEVAPPGPINGSLANLIVWDEDYKPNQPDTPAPVANTTGDGPSHNQVALTLDRQKTVHYEAKTKMFQDCADAIDKELPEGQDRAIPLCE
ncbi:hypothetical protein HD806DRAFT_530593 [Xylariaceae sp. AK1471]|nr:hypothetical protein HD806DRAFT_530593 [Xylariaceae sp. AK1471]